MIFDQYLISFLHHSQDSFEHGTAPDPSLIVAIAIEAMASFSGLGTPAPLLPHTLFLPPPTLPPHICQHNILSTEYRPSIDYVVSYGNFLRTRYSPSPPPPVPLPPSCLINIR